MDIIELAGVDALFGVVSVCRTGSQVIALPSIVSLDVFVAPFVDNTRAPGGSARRKKPRDAVILIVMAEYPWLTRADIIDHLGFSSRARRSKRRHSALEGGGEEASSAGSDGEESSGEEDLDDRVAVANRAADVVWDELRDIRVRFAYANDATYFLL